MAWVQLLVAAMFVLVLPLVFLLQRSGHAEGDMELVVD